MAETVLVISEEESIRQALGQGLLRHGLDVVFEKSPVRALERAVDEQPSAVVVNLDAEGTAGLDICRAFKRSAQTAGIPVLAISSARELSRVESILSHGADDHVARPFHVNRFLQKVDSLLERRRQSRQEEEVREDVDALASRIARKARALGNMVEIFPGVVERPASALVAVSRAQSWAEVIAEPSVSRFAILPQRQRVRFDRLGLVQVPPQTAYLPQKVIVRRNAEPLVAAVDGSGCPVASGLFSLVPAKGLSCEYLACVLNSRITDFWLARVLRGGSRKVGSLSREELEKIPIVLASGWRQGRIGRLHDQLLALQIKPQTPGVQLKSARAFGEIERQLASAYRLNASDLESLATLA